MTLASTDMLVRESIRSLLIMLALAAGSLFLTAPAAAWNAHLAEHAGNPVAIDEHHDHDALATSSDLHSQPVVPEQDGGAKHDHMASASACFSASLHDGPDLAPRPISAAPLVRPPSAVLREVRPPPLSRPPRSA